MSLLIFTIGLSSASFGQNCASLEIDKFCCDKFRIAINSNLTNTCYDLQIDGETYNYFPGDLDLIPNQPREVCITFMGEDANGEVCCEKICETVVYDHVVLEEDFSIDLCESFNQIDICTEMLYDLDVSNFGEFKLFTSNGSLFYLTNVCDVLSFVDPIELHYEYRDECGCLTKTGTLSITRYRITSTHVVDVNVAEGCCVNLEPGEECPEGDVTFVEWYENGAFLKSGVLEHCYCPTEGDYVSLRQTDDACEICEYEFRFTVTGTKDVSPKYYNHIQKCTDQTLATIVNNLVQCETCGDDPVNEKFHVDADINGSFSVETYGNFLLHSFYGDNCDNLPDPFYLRYTYEDCKGNVLCTAYIYITYECCD